MGLVGYRRCCVVNVCVAFGFDLCLGFWCLPDLVWCCFCVVFSWWVGCGLCWLVGGCGGWHVCLGLICVTMCVACEI